MKPEEKLYERVWERKGGNRKAPSIDEGSRIDIAFELLEKGGILLDVGCGDGTFGYFAKQRYKKICGVDISKKALEIAKKRGITVRKVNLNEENLPFRNNYFDATICLDVIEHVFEPEDLIKEINRVLKKEGMLILSTPNIRCLSNLFPLIFKGEFPKTSGDTQHYDGGHLHYFTFKDIENLLKKYGFRVVVKKGVFGKNFLKEFFSPGILIKAKKAAMTR